MNKKINWLFWGILLCPIIFAWMLLNKEYSTKSRIIGFSWMIFITIISLKGLYSDNISTYDQSKLWYSHDIEMIESGSISHIYTNYIKENLRDPSSYEFISANYLLINDSIKYKSIKKQLKSYNIKPKIDSTMIIEINYRARNGFGGMNIESSHFVVTPTTYVLIRK